MNLNNLFSILKGSSRSGNFGHSGRPGKRGGSTPGGFSFSITNDEINQILSQPYQKLSLKLSKELIDRYSNQYDFWKNQDSIDARLLEKVEMADKLPPIIVVGTPERWHVTDGSHRLAVAAKRGMTSIAAYLL